MATIACVAQPNSIIRLPKMNFGPNGYDTVGVKNAVKLAEETQGIVEKAVDPDEYILGPGDFLLVNINGAQPLSFDIPVTPDGRVLVPAVPAVDVRNTTLADAQVKIIESVKSVYRGQVVDVSLRKLKTFKVSLLGAVRKPMVVSAGGTDRVSEVIDRAGGMLSTASLRRIHIDREGGQRIPVDILRYFSTGEERFNPYVLGGDKITVPYIIDEDCIYVEGSVYQPGPYEFVAGDSLLDMISYAHGMTSMALPDSVEISHYEESGMRMVRNVVSLRERGGNVAMHFGDRVYVRQRTGAYDRIEIAIDGGVAHPGRYAITPKVDRLADIIQRAGGYTDDAQPETGLLYRRKDFTWWDKELDRLSKMKMENMNDNEMRYYRTKSSENMGLVSVDFQKIMTSGDPNDNPILVDKDSIYIPKSTNYVNLIGRVIKPGRVPYDKKLGYMDYIKRAGGFGLHADEDEVLIQKGSGELHRASDYLYKMDPGDNILVPERSDVRFIDVFTKALAITAQLATIVGVVLGVVFAYKK